MTNPPSHVSFTLVLLLLNVKNVNFLLATHLHRGIIAFKIDSAVSEDLGAGERLAALKMADS